MQRLCKYGKNCRSQANCHFLHPEVKHYGPAYCHFGSKCRNVPHCRFYHPEHSMPIGVTSHEQQPANQYQTHSEPDLMHISHSTTASDWNQQDPAQRGTKSVRQIQDGSMLSGRMDKFVEMEQRQPQQNSSTDNFNTLNKIHRGQQKYLEGMLEGFFNVRLIKSTKFDAIYSLIEQNVSLENVPLLIQQIQRLEESEFAPHFTYLKIVKTLIARKLDFDQVCLKLQKEYKIKMIKEQKQAHFVRQIPNPIAYEVLNDCQLLQLAGKGGKNERCFLVDGDNVLHTHKVFRKLYRSGRRQTVAEAQVRLRWLVSEIGNCVVFFDYEKGSQLEYRVIADKIMYEDQIKEYSKQQWRFAQNYDHQQETKPSNHKDNSEQENQEAEQVQDDDSLPQSSSTKSGRNADSLILEQIEQCHKQTKQAIQAPKEIILVTGDRLLIQKSLQMASKNAKLLISSGRYFIKFCKEHIRRKYYGNKIKKGVIKRIFAEPH